MRFLLACCYATVVWGQDPTGGDPRQQVASAERPPIELAQRWISDSRPLYRAWAAELIRRHELWYFRRELTDALGDLSQLAPESIHESDEDKMRLGILDALIQLGIRPPTSVSQALLTRYPAPALVLLYGGGCPGVKVGAYVIDRCHHDEHWLLAAQCLASQPGGPVELLQRLRIEAQVRVYDPNRGESQFPKAALGGIISPIRISARPDDWPELHTYQLAARCDVRLGCTLLMGGKYPVYCVRGSVRAPVGWLGSHIPRDRNEDVLELLADRLGMKRESLDVMSHPSADLPWTTAEHYRSDLEAFVADHQRRYSGLVTLLRRHTDLTPEESQRCRLNLDIGVIDGRLDQTQSLPNLGIGDHPR
jgi:hypothetical protein